MVYLQRRKGEKQSYSRADEVGKHKVLNRPFIDNITVRYFAVRNFSPAPKGVGRKREKTLQTERRGESQKV